MTGGATEPPRRILYYNWVDYLDDERRGGGVTVYQRNLMAALAAEGADAVFLSSGISYDLGRRGLRWERVRHGPEQDRDRRYEIVNSGVLSPAHHSFGNPAQLEEPATQAAFFDFIERTGPYDVIHFNNLEGLPADVLTLKTRWPRTRVILSLHNYYPVCPQVNLWHQERAACTDFEGGAKCGACLPHKPDERLVRLANGLAYHLKCAGIRPGTRAFDLIFRQAMRVGGRGARAAGWLGRRLRGAPVPAAVRPDPGGFAARRAGMTERINAHCDLVLCVSDRVRQIAESYGISSAILRTSYIGARDAALYDQTRPKPMPSGENQTLTLGFLGYMRRDKGFFFLLDALESMPDDLVARLRLTIAALPGPPAALARLEALRPRLAGLRHVNGYSHDQLDALLADVDVGLIPALWEDNLPQVAIEMHARHIPLLTSDMGGARELANCPAMVFAAGDTAAFSDRIRALLAGEVDWHAYWQGARPPRRMDLHLDELNRLYKGETAPELSPAAP
ncbi:glycosyltransferase [Ruegeria marina]|uniref:Glycosyl transferase 4-like domain-containing protein n=1 Tax=Ruegeria marina TaxID=639004 RepID=A0A1G7E7L9_9RHOB|nr:glycosyltransferase [Ruegeria marina]SDE59466.1 Glycosyl transferase 4-like domain-containing protein [Ruegeria marina]